MKRLAESLTMFTALTAAVSAADLPRRAPPPVFTPVPVFTWTGAYFGVNAGYVINTQDPAFTTSTNATLANNVTLGGRAALVRTDADGFSAGGQIGYNYQFTPGSGVVVGVEADAAYTDIDARRFFATSLGNNLVQNRLDFLGTVRGRLGYAFDRVLVYGTGGFAYGNVRSSASFFNSPSFGGQLAYTGVRDGFQYGYAVGDGIEYALPTESFLNFFKSSAVTIKAEALYYDLGRRNVAIAAIIPTAIQPGYLTRFENNGVIARGGINYKFGTY